MVATIVDTQLEWEIVANEQKTVCLVEVRGKLSRKVRAQLGKEIDEIGMNGQKFKIRVVLRARYLGTTIGDTGDGINAEIKIRINEANKIMGTLTPVWKQTKLALEKKAQLYTSLVRSVMCYSMEVRELTTAQIKRLEATQVRHLRRILKSPAHVTKENNRTVRKEMNIPSIDTYLQASRLMFWKKQVEQRNEALWVANWGQLKDRTETKGTMKSVKAGVQRMKTDMAALYTANKWEMKQLDKDHQGLPVLNNRFWQALERSSKKAIRNIHKSQKSKAKRTKTRKVNKKEQHHVKTVERNLQTRQRWQHTNGKHTKPLPPSDN